MDEVKQKLTDLIDALEKKELQVNQTNQIVEEKAKKLAIREKELATQQQEFEIKMIDLEKRETSLQNELRIDRERKEVLDARERQLNQDKARIQKYLNI